MRAAIVGITGPALSADEAALFRRLPPAGVILFGRNIEGPAQLRRLTGGLRAVLPPEAAIMVDQEGGRVARLRPPSWCAHPPARVLGALNPARRLRAAWLTGALIGLDCAAAGFDVACAPVLDLAVPGASDVVGDRAYSDDPVQVAMLGRAVADGLLAAGVQPVGKHAPGHGRALVDSHHALPAVAGCLDGDMLPFTACAALPWMMTAHILYLDLDSARPGTLSPVVIGQAIRGRIGFQGVLVSDDLAMRALAGTPGSLAAQAVAAGCDLALHCTGVLADSAAVLDAVPDAGPATLDRMQAARRLASSSRAVLDGVALMAERDGLLA